MVYRETGDFYPITSAHDCFQKELAGGGGGGQQQHQKTVVEIDSIKLFTERRAGGANTLL